MPVVICPPYFSPILLEQLNKAGYDPYFDYNLSLMHMEGADGSTAFVDQMGNPPTLIGGTVSMSTLVSRVGTSSASFLGTAGLRVPTPAVGTADFTIECWIQINNPNTDTPYIFDTRPTGVGSGLYSAASYNFITKTLSYTSNTTNAPGIAATFTFDPNRWYHFAVARVSGVTKMFVDGNMVGSAYPDVNSLIGTNLTWGWNNALSTQGLIGYIDEARMTAGVGRYVTTFDPPTTAFPNQFANSLSDPYFGSNSSLLHLDGNNGDNNTIPLSSIVETTGLTTFIANGTAGAVSTSATVFKFGSGSLNFTGAGWLRDVSSLGAMAFGTGNFTMEAWVYIPSTTSGAYRSIFSSRAGSSTSDSTVGAFGINPSGSLYWYTGGFICNGGPTIAANTWTHVALVRNGTTVSAYVNGALASSGAGGASHVSPAGFGFGANSQAGDELFTGYIDEARITKGVARYTAPFAVPTAPFGNNVTDDPNYASTVLLMRGDSVSLDISDLSPNNLTISKLGNVGTSIYSPYVHTGGSLVFNGTDAYLSISDHIGVQPGPADFTIEFWWRPTDTNGNNHTVLAKGLGMQFVQNSNALQVMLSLSNNTTYFMNSTVGTIVANTWYHVALVRSGTTYTPYLNGVAGPTGIQSNPPSTGTSPMTIGGQVGAAYMKGHITNVRMVKQALYTGNFVPPSGAPFAVVQDATFLALLSPLMKTIYDSTGLNTFTSYGTASLRTAIKRFGTASLYLDGTGYMKDVDSTSMVFGTNNYTIEAWIYTTTSSTTFRSILSSRPIAGNLQGSASLGVSGTGFPYWYSGAAYVVAGPAGTIPNNMWTHLAICRIGTTTTMYVNGVSVATTTGDTINYNIVGTYIGSNGDGSEPYIGHLDDLRITKGVARYTTNFVPVQNAFASTSAVNNVYDPNTSCVLDFDATPIVDVLGLTTLINTNVTASTQSFVRNGAGYFNGAAYLTATTSSAFTFGTSDFTIECFVKSAVYGGTNTIVDTRTATNSTTGALLYINTSGQLCTIVADSGLVASTVSMTLNRWHHIALVRSGGVVKTYLNGNVAGSGIGSGSITDATFSVGKQNAAVTDLFTGFVDTFVVTKNVAKYTTTFTPTT